MKRKSSFVKFAKEVTKTMFQVSDQYVEHATTVFWVGTALKLGSWAVSKILDKVEGGEQ